MLSIFIGPIFRPVKKYIYKSFCEKTDRYYENKNRGRQSQNCLPTLFGQGRRIAGVVKLTS